MPYEAEFLSRSVARKRIEFEGGAWVEIRAEALAGDEAAGLDAVAGLRADMARLASEGAVGAEVSMSIGAYRLAQLERRIVAWSASEPIDAEHVAMLPALMADRILDEIARLDADRSDDQKKDLSGNASAPSAARPARLGRRS